MNGVLHFPPAISRPNRRLPFFSKRRRSRSGEWEPSEAILPPCSVFVLLRLPYISVLSPSPEMAPKCSLRCCAPPSPPAAAYANRIISLASRSGRCSGLTFTLPLPASRHRRWPWPGKCRDMAAEEKPEARRIKMY